MRTLPGSASMRALLGRISLLVLAAALTWAPSALAAGVATTGAATSVTPTSATGVPGVATTLPATSVGTSTATLNGKVDTQGIDGEWAFAYGTTTAYTSYTSIQALAGGSAVPVKARLSNLKPGTTYHFKLVVLQGSYPYQTASTGADFTFTTAIRGGTGGSSSSGGRSSLKYGIATLLSRRLAVHNGIEAASLRCSGAKRAVCKGKVSITARGRIAGRTRTVSCGWGSYASSTGHTRTVRGRLSGDCARLLRSASHHKLAATLLVSFSTHQVRLRAGVVLVG
jgi:hypothetical protein